MYKCSKDDPNKARNEETENRSVKMLMQRFIKVTVAGKPGYSSRAGMSMKIRQAAKQPHKKCQQESTVLVGCC